MTAPRSVVACAACLVALAACGGTDRDHVVRDVRPGGGDAPRLGATSAERFGMSPSASTLEVPGAFTHALPDGWEALAPSPMKEVDLRAPGDVAVWVSRLSGNGGGPVPNLTRWRAQLGLGPASQAMLDDAVRVPLLDTSAWRVDLTDADGARRMVGLMAFRDTSSVFVRMSGSSDAVEAQLAAFGRFVASLAEAAALAPPAAAGRSSADGLSWSAPASWFALAPNSFRLAHFRVAPGVEAWITVLGGDGGGVAANVARWCEQYGHDPLDQAAIDALPPLPMLGGEAVFVDLTGADDSRGMIGVVRELGERSVFVKMDGPSPAVRAHENAFRRFCATLELDG